MTPWGRFRFLRNPQGLISAGDEFNRRTDETFERINNMAKIVDDCLAYDADFDTHVLHVREILTRARECGITISPKKFEFGMSKVDFCGFTVCEEGWTVDDDVTQDCCNQKLPHANMSNGFTILYGFGESVFRFYEVFGRRGSTNKASLENDSGICVG